MTPDASAAREPNDPLYSDEYYELLERLLGEEKAAWARLPRAERERQLTLLHAQYDTPDDLDEWPPELGGGRFNP
jgi:hypothetical protein